VLLAVLAAGAEPFFCDVDESTGLVTDTEWARARASGANVALVVHLYGNPLDTRHVTSLFEGPDCLVLDDAAQAFGSRLHGRRAGSAGDVGLLSFGSTKQIAIGNAALLFRDACLADEVRTRLAQQARPGPASAGWAAEQRTALAGAFRAKLEKARERLRDQDADPVAGFAGLLEGLDPVLDVAPIRGLDAPLVQAIGSYDQLAQQRIGKAALWARLLDGTGLQPVGMGEGTVPWRYACRLPGISWAEQHRIADNLRARSVHVSNWYLPVHWFMRQPVAPLPGVERLAREVFQFWLDEATSESDIEAGAACVRRELAA